MIIVTKKKMNELIIIIMKIPWGSNSMTRLANDLTSDGPSVKISSKVNKRTTYSINKIGNTNCKILYFFSQNKLKKNTKPKLTLKKNEIRHTNRIITMHRKKELKNKDTLHSPITHGNHPIYKV